MSNKKGISLIVLVITIIVMIILAASVVITLTNTGIINRADTAVKKTTLSDVQTVAALRWHEAYMDNYRGVNLVNKVKADLAEYSAEVDVYVTEKDVTVTHKATRMDSLVSFDINGVNVGGYTTSTSYHENSSNYPIILGRPENVSNLKEVRVFVKANGETDDKYVQKEVMVYPSTTKYTSVAGSNLGATAGLTTIIYSLDRDTSWIIKVVYIYNDNTAKCAISNPTAIACFEAGTKVYTENGLLNIEDVKAGMKVYSRNLETGANEIREVLSTSARTIRTAMYKVTVNNETINSTDNHPYYVKNVGFVEAKSLKAGDVLVDVNGEEQIVTGVELLDSKDMVTVYNMNVEGNHNYYVGENMILVHNATCPN